MRVIPWYKTLVNSGFIARKVIADSKCMCLVGFKFEAPFPIADQVFDIWRGVFLQNIYHVSSLTFLLHKTNSTKTFICFS